MSWKSFVSAGLLCALASPAFAQPTMSVVRGGTVANNHLDSNGNWVWAANITPDYALVPDSSGTPIAAELGFTSSSTAGTNATVSSAVVGADMVTSGVHGNANANPGNVIFGWEATTNLGGTGDCDSANPGICPTGVQIGGASNTQVFSALGSDNETAGALQYLLMTVGRPVVSLATPNTSTTITVSGAYDDGADTDNGRIAQVNGMDGATYLSGNYDTFDGVFTRNARGGDSDLNGTVNFADFQTSLLLNYNQSGRSWQHGDYDGNGTVNFTDFQILLTQFNSSYAVGGSAGGAAAAAAGVPEPTSLLLVLLAAMPLFARRSRKTL